MAKTDRHFKTVFSAVLGILIAIALVLIGVSRMVDSGPKGARDTDDPLMQASAHERIKPFGQVAVAGEDNAALAIAIAPISPVSASGAGAPAAAGATDGKSVLRNGLRGLSRSRTRGRTKDRRQGRLGAAHRAGHRDT